MFSHVVSKAGTEPDSEHCKDIEKFLVQNLNANEKAKRKRVAYPLTVIDGKGIFRWEPPGLTSFAELKVALVKAVPLAHPNYSKKIEVCSDACGYGIAEDQAMVESPVCRPTRNRQTYEWIKNMLLLALVCGLGQMGQANEMRGKFIVAEGMEFHQNGTLALSDSEWIVIYDESHKTSHKRFRVSALEARVV
ncbi:hypothetical protein OUZ56_011881 [Daphnia magna]|uniref:Reverse transcriptase/retrotransposon-derived protein RNase H-like domain-containing protein n=1 Tax=Daphnia magna TaxID=35525 RepID=A0ABQ9Z1N5_9CRUS|nr:hypothetical protein OUZ56_011881 [Daphnia magna]